MELVGGVALVLAIALACTAAIWDIRHRTIPNWLCLVTAICGLLVAAVPFDASLLLMHAAHLLVALVIGMGLFALRWWGGGDAKLYAAVAGWFPVAEFFQLMFWISIAGVLLVLGVFVRRGRMKRPRGEAGRALPYGVAIAAGMIATLASRMILA